MKREQKIELVEEVEPVDEVEPAEEADQVEEVEEVEEVQQVEEVEQVEQEEPVEAVKPVEKVHQIKQVFRTVHYNVLNPVVTNWVAARKSGFYNGGTAAPLGDLQFWSWHFFISMGAVKLFYFLI